MQMGDFRVCIAHFMKNKHFQDQKQPKLWLITES